VRVTRFPVKVSTVLEAIAGIVAGFKDWVNCWRRWWDIYKIWVYIIF
jgi:hypothetical protein